MLGRYDDDAFRFGHERPTTDSLDRSINAALTAQSRRADAEHKQRVELSKPMTMGAIKGYLYALAKYEGGGIPDIKVLGTIELRAERTLQEEREGSKLYKATQRLLERLHDYRASRATERKDDYTTAAEAKLRARQEAAGEGAEGHSGGQGRYRGVTDSIDDVLHTKPSVGSVIHVTAKSQSDNGSELIAKIQYRGEFVGDTTRGTVFVKSQYRLQVPWRGDVEIEFVHPEKPVFAARPYGESASPIPRSRFHRPY